MWFSCLIFLVSPWSCIQTRLHQCCLGWKIPEDWYEAVQVPGEIFNCYSSPLWADIFLSFLFTRQNTNLHRKKTCQLYWQWIQQVCYPSILLTWNLFSLDLCQHLHGWSLWSRKSRKRRVTHHKLFQKIWICSKSWTGILGNQDWDERSVQIPASSCIAERSFSLSGHTDDPRWGQLNKTKFGGLQKIWAGYLDGRLNVEGDIMEKYLRDFTFDDEEYLD